MAADPEVRGDSFGVYQLDIADFEWRRPLTEGETMPEPVREGGCHCGALRYRVRGEPVAVAVCHCADCQRQSGSAFGMSMIVRDEAFSWLAGEPASFLMKADSGADKECVFCPACGVRILNRIRSRPGTVNVKPGTLDETRWLTPAVQVWTSNKQGWLELPAGLPAFAKNPPARS